MDEVTLPTNRKWYHSGGFSVALIGGIIVLVLIFIRILPQSTNTPTTLDVTLNPRNFRAVATANTDVHTLDDPSLGPKDAKVVVVEFGDFQCPFCRQAFPVLRELTQIYKDKVLFQFRDYPIPDLHPDATLAAQASQCAWEQGSNQFWAYHDRLYLQQESLTKADLGNHATATGLDVAAFSACLDSNKYADEVEEDYSAGVQAGVRGTPTFFINRERFEGPLTKEVFQAILEQKLNAAS